MLLCKACSFTVFCQKKCHKKRKKESDTWMDCYLMSRSCQFFIQKFHADIRLILHNLIKPLNIVSTNSFSWGPNFTSTWDKNDLRRLQLSRINANVLRRLQLSGINNSEKNSLFFLPICQEEVSKVIFVWFISKTYILLSLHT